MPPKILIAEDNDTIAGALEGLLQRKGMTTERAADGVLALSSIIAAPPDALILDLQLPRLHGIELLKKLRQSPRTRDLPVVVVTGVYKGEKYIQAARALGVSSYLEKPFRAADLLAALHQALGTTTPPTPAPAPSTSREATMDRHLLRAFTNRFTGTYLLKSADGERNLVFLNGLPVSLRPGFSSKSFGDYLHRRGLLSAEECGYYISPGDHNHELLVSMGCLEYPELLQEKFAYLSSELVDAFAAPPMVVEERPTPGAAGLQAITVNVPNIFYQGFRRHLLPARQQALGERLSGKYLAPAKNYFRYINFLTLSDEEKSLLHRLDGSCTLGQALGEETPLPPLIFTLATLDMVACGDHPLMAAVPEFPLRTLFNAYQEEIEIELSAEEPLESFSDLVDQEEGPAPIITRSPIPPAPAATTEGTGGSDLATKVRETLARLKGKNYYETFGMTQGKFSFDLLKTRYFALTREFGPETLMQLAGRESALVEEILSSVTTAYNTLSDVVKKERYDELLGSEKVGLGQVGDDLFQAQIQAQSGKVFLEMEEWDNAEKSLQDACNIDPQNGDYLAHLAWSIYRNPSNLSSRAMQDKVRQMLNRALTLDRGANAYAFKGYMLFEAGQDSLAEAEFTKALKLDARQAMARKGLRELQEKREQEKKGMFRRMFR
jgi:CheY-like chemotaxis protein/tetratricopeptide (TPR) repeat protein